MTEQLSAQIDILKDVPTESLIGGNIMKQRRGIS